MKRIEHTPRFKKDLKRYKYQPARLKRLFDVVTLLAKGELLPTNCRPHRLIGNYAGYLECHIEGDLLLLWVETNEEGEEVIYLSRFGSHSELF